MQQHINVLEIQLGNNSKDNNKNPSKQSGLPKKMLTHQYKNPKPKGPPKQEPLPNQPIKKKLITQDDYENIPQTKTKIASKESKIDGAPMKNILQGNANIEDPKIINTINLIANNPKRYKCTNKILREIGQISNNKNVGFLSQKGNEEMDPSSKLSNYLGEKLMEENKAKMMSNDEDEDHYYNNLVSYIKSEMKKKGTFDFTKLSEKDRKLLAQKKLYSRMDNNSSNNKNTDIIPLKDNIINYDKGKKNDDFTFKNKYYSKENVPYENYSEGEKEEKKEEEEKIERKDDNIINKDSKNEESGKSKEKLTARQILENIHKKIILDNERLVNEMEAKTAKRNYKKK